MITNTPWSPVIRKILSRTPQSLLHNAIQLRSSRGSLQIRHTRQGHVHRTILRRVPGRGCLLALQLPFAARRKRIRVFCKLTALNALNEFRSYDAFQEGGLRCSSVLTSSTVIHVPTGSVTVKSGQTLVMHAVFVAWASSDLTKFTPASAPLLRFAPETTSTSVPLQTTIITSGLSVETVLITPTPSAPATSSSSQEAAQQSDMSTARRGLSTGAQAGIGVGVGMVGLALLLAALWFLLRRKKHQDQPVANIAAYEQVTHEKGMREVHHGKHASELSAVNGEIARSATEADSIHVCAELDGGSSMQGSHRQSGLT